MEPESDEEQFNILKVQVGKINRKEFQVDKKIESQSGLFQMLSNTQGFNYDFEEIEPEEFEKCLEYLELHEYSPPKVKIPIKSHILQQNLCPIDYEFIKSYDIYDNKQFKLKKLLNAAIYLQLKTLEQVCICKIATQFYYGTDSYSFQQLKQELQVEKDITLEEEQKLRQKYPWIDQQQ